LIHGYPLDHTLWAAQLRGLSDAARVIAPDLPGFGGSDVIEDATMGTYADFVRELLDQIGAREPAVAAGLSMGGYIVFEYWRRYPKQVAGLILSNTKAGADSTAAREGRDNSAATARKQGAGAIAEAMLPKMLSPKSADNAPLVNAVREMMARQPVPGIVAALMAMKERPDSTFDMANIHAPTLVITGADDVLIPPSESEILERGIPDARRVVLPDAGHLSNVEQPELWNRAVRELLAAL
jgi:3-oxoadipate enol-lactonase